VDAFTAIKGKCTWWREMPHPEDADNVRIKAEEKRITCSCFVEGDLWNFPRAEVPVDCPKSRHCRYYIRHG